MPHTRTFSKTLCAGSAVALHLLQQEVPAPQVLPLDTPVEPLQAISTANNSAAASHLQAGTWHVYLGVPWKGAYIAQRQLENVQAHQPNLQVSAQQQTAGAHMASAVVAIAETVPDLADSDAPQAAKLSSGAAPCRECPLGGPVSEDSTGEQDDGGSSKEPLQAVTGQQGVSNEHTVKWRLCTDMGRERITQRRLADAEVYLSQALEHAKKGFGEKDGHVASASNNLAELYALMGRAHEAAPLYDQALQLLEYNYGPMDVRLAMTLHNVGTFALARGLLQRADSLLTRSLAIKRETFGVDAVDCGPTLAQLGETRLRQGKLLDAIVLYQEALRVTDKEHQLSANAMKYVRRLTNLLMDSGQPDEAVELLRQLLMRQHAYEAADPSTIIRLTDLLAEALQHPAHEPAPPTPVPTPRRAWWPWSAWQPSAATSAAVSAEEASAGPSLSRPSDSDTSEQGGTQGESTVTTAGSAATSRAVGWEARRDEAVALLKESLQRRQEVHGADSLPAARGLMSLAQCVARFAEDGTMEGQANVNRAIEMVRRSAAISGQHWQKAVAAFNLPWWQEKLLTLLNQSPKPLLGGWLAGVEYAEALKMLAYLHMRQREEQLAATCVNGALSVLRHPCMEAFLAAARVPSAASGASTPYAVPDEGIGRNSSTVVAKSSDAASASVNCGSRNNDMPPTAGDSSGTTHVPAAHSQSSTGSAAQQARERFLGGKQQRQVRGVAAHVTAMIQELDQMLWQLQSTDGTCM